MLRRWRRSHGRRSDSEMSGLNTYWTERREERAASRRALWWEWARQGPGQRPPTPVLVSYCDTFASLSFVHALPAHTSTHRHRGRPQGKCPPRPRAAPVPLPCRWRRQPPRVSRRCCSGPTGVPPTSHGRARLPPAPSKSRRRSGPGRGGGGDARRQPRARAPGGRRSWRGEGGRGYGR